jgi:hypothetical protein
VVAGFRWAVGPVQQVLLGVPLQKGLDVVRYRPVKRVHAARLSMSLWVKSSRRLLAAA